MAEKATTAGTETPPPTPPEEGAPESFGPRYDSLVEYEALTPGVAPHTPPPTDTDAEDNNFTRKLETISTDPGVYLLKDRNGKVLYVGKAKSLRPRVRAYFRDGGDGRFQVRFLMKRVRDFDTLVARSEKEALILENNLIKQYKPRYNIRLKDDKSYLSAKVTNHAWPRITVTRRIVKDGGRYFGPFGSADGLRETMDVIRKVFPLRTCSDAVFRNRARPCIEYQIKRCLGPCCLPVDRDEYARHLLAAEMLLEGKNLEAAQGDARADAGVCRAARVRGGGPRPRSRARYREDGRAPDGAASLGRRPGRSGSTARAGLSRRSVLMVRNGKLTSTRGWSFQGSRISRSGNPGRPAHAILCGCALPAR